MFVKRTNLPGLNRSTGWALVIGGQGAPVAFLDCANEVFGPVAPFGGIGASGTGARFGGTANLEAFTEIRWVTVRGEIAPYPF